MFDGSPISWSQNWMVRDELYAGCDVIRTRKAILNHAATGCIGSLLGHLFISLERVLSIAIGALHSPLTTCRGDSKPVTGPHTINGRSTLSNVDKG